MPYPRWLAKVNKRFFNPKQIRKVSPKILS